ncbi:AAA family ATPase [Prevotella sp.]|uniref:AAA family ATPase n=1 Tax=Prevotella sp. TaxID=59823 RepID=UPI00402A3F97
MNALLRFTIENFRSFAERKSLVLSHEPLDGSSSSLSYLRVCALYGANSSGKSNLINALARMRYIILNSVKVNDGEDLEYEPFLLSDKKNEPTLYELEFVLSDKHYRYGFSNDSKMIVQEWLYCIDPNSIEIPLVIRDQEGIGVNDKEFPEGVDMEERTNDNRLFLSLVAQLGGSLSKKLISFFSKSLNILSGLDTDDYLTFSARMLKEEKNVATLMKNFFNRVQLGFSDVSTRTQDFDAKSLPKDMPEELKKLLVSNLTGKKSVSIFSVHGCYDSNGNLLENQNFPFDQMESEGTKKLFEISGPIFDTLLEGNILFVDELDAKMHPLLSRELVRLFTDESTNSKGAQLIFTTHDTNLLSSNLLNSNEVWFTEKDQQERSDLYCLNDIRYLDGSKMEETDLMEHNYIQGRYGAIPYL